MDKTPETITMELWGIYKDDTKFTPEHRLFCAILLKAVQEAIWKKVIITYAKAGLYEKRAFYSRCNNAISYLRDTDRDDLTSVMSLCDLFDIKYKNIEKIINSRPTDFKHIEEAHFKFHWTNKGWRLVSSQRRQIYGGLLRNCMFDIKLC